MKLIHLIFGLLLLITASCGGAKKIVVKYADTYIERQVGKRLPLYDNQEEIFAKDVDKFLNENKDRVRNFIPHLEIINFDSTASLDEQYPKLTSAYLEIAEDFSRILARHMSAFDKTQVKGFLKKIREENNVLFKRDRKERRDRIESRIKSLLGSLTDKQKEILKNHQDVFDDQVVKRSERRSDLHKKFKMILEEDTSRETKENLLFESFVEYQRKSLAESKNLMIAKEFVPTLTPPQKTSLKKNLIEIQEMIAYFIETVY